MTDDFWPEDEVDGAPALAPRTTGEKGAPAPEPAERRIAVPAKTPDPARQPIYAPRPVDGVTAVAGVPVQLPPRSTDSVPAPPPRVPARPMPQDLPQAPESAWARPPTAQFPTVTPAQAATPPVPVQRMEPLHGVPHQVPPAPLPRAAEPPEPHPVLPGRPPALPADGWPDDDLTAHESAYDDDAWYAQTGPTVRPAPPPVTHEFHFTGTFPTSSREAEESSYTVESHGDSGYADHRDRDYYDDYDDRHFFDAGTHAPAGVGTHAPEDAGTHAPGFGPGTHAPGFGAGTDAPEVHDAEIAPPPLPPSWPTRVFEPPTAAPTPAADQDLPLYEFDADSQPDGAYERPADLPATGTGDAPGRHSFEHPPVPDGPPALPGPTVRPVPPGTVHNGADFTPSRDPARRVDGFAPGVPTAEEFARRRAARQPEPEARMGVQAALRRSTFGLVSPGPGKKEREHRHNVELIRRNFGGLRQVTVVNPKGGAGKTVAVLMLAMTFGQRRGGYVLAWDNNETQGTLGMRAQQDFHARTVRDLLRDLHFFTGASGRVGDLSQYVRAQGEGMFEVLASDESATAGEMLTDVAFGDIRDVVSRFYKVIVVDTGNNVRAPNWQAAVDATDQLVVTMSARNDSAETAARMLDHLEQTGRTRAVRQAVTVVSMPANQRDLDVDAIERHFAARTREVIRVPFERVIDSGEPIRYARLSDATAAAWVKVAAAVAEGL
ncbi:chromosome partitioning protein [Hamadaea tsunoensis]|uniref:chromosome partitioning protein n=1 Tax=Hamadaea tsunoensis TaxID=53368 RepID=UPI00040E6E3B|nr:chromosome partitioning protein [Hamadaea tsunoensis]